jgi:hypothetical protein
MSLLELYSEPYERKAESGPTLYGDATEWPDYSQKHQGWDKKKTVGDHYMK